MSPRLALVISSLGMGGAERVLTQLAGAWRDQGVEVTVITLAGRDQDFHRLPAGVGRAALGLTAASRGPVGAVAANLERVRALRRELRRARPHAAVSFMDATNVLTILAATGLGVPVVASERIDLAGHQAKLGPAWRWLRRRTYPRAAAVVAVTRAVAQQVRQTAPGARVTAIANPVDPAGCSQPPELELAGPLVAGLGRLVPRKGFGLLVRAFARAARDRPQWRLAILGEGPERAGLEELSRRLGLEGRVLLPGMVKRPLPLLAQADVFALCSSYEGFPNSLVEAMACGLAVVTTGYAGGRDEVLGPGEGLVVPVDDEEALAAALGRLMDDVDLRRELGEAARRGARRYSRERVLEQWNRLLERVSGGHFAQNPPAG
jgi:glycosyltransferase involved in cell wall biosynthesis